jgi:hypothetical protein
LILFKKDEYGDDEYPDRWWAVTACEAQYIEVTEPPEYFEEHIEWWYKPKIYYYAPVRVTYRLSTRLANPLTD